MVDAFGTAGAFLINEEKEYERNGERYAFLRWGAGAFDNFRVVPPGTGICHQVNLEYLSQTVWTKRQNGDARLAFPDTLVGTDSHTTMVNGLSVLGWGVGGIEAEAAMLGQPISMLIPEVIGFRISGKTEGRRHRHRPRAHRHRAPAAHGRGRQVRGVLRRGAGESAARGPRHHRQHGAGIWRDLRLLPRRRGDAQLSRGHRPQGFARRAGSRPMRKRKACIGTPIRPTPSSPRRWRSISTRSSRRSRVRGARRTACRSRARRNPSPRRSTRNMARLTRPESAWPCRAAISISAMATW